MRPLLGALSLAVAGLLILSCPRQPEGLEDPGPSDVPPGLTNGDSLEVILYFPGVGERLYGEQRSLPDAAGLEEQVRLTIESLLQGPTGDALVPPLPDGTLVRAVNLLDRTVAVDLRSSDGGPPPNTGSLREMLSLYSLVNTVVINFDEIDRLLLVWNGRQPTTFGGHLDTTRPLNPEPGLIAR